MSKDKPNGDCKNCNSHIEEMAVTTCSLYREYFDKKCAGNSECDFNCHHYDRCEKLYEKGYRNQSEIISEFSEAVKHIAEGVKFKNDTEKTAFIEMLDDLTRVKMKGGAE